MSKDRDESKCADIQELNPDELKSSVREMLASMPVSERKLFINSLENELSSKGLRLGAYLIPLGMASGRTEQLTTNEVAHLVRFLRLNVPIAVPALMQVWAEYSARREEINRVNQHLEYSITNNRKRIMKPPYKRRIKSITQRLSITVLVGLLLTLSARAQNPNIALAIIPGTDASASHSSFPLNVSLAPTHR